MAGQLGAHPPSQQAQLDNQVLHRKRLKGFGMDEARRVAADAFELMKHTLDQARTTAGWAFSQRYLAAHKGGATALFHHF
jgi:hypothetical protein